MKKKNIIIIYLLIGFLSFIYSMEQLFGYLLFQISVIISWWIGFICFLLGLCLICRGLDLLKIKS
jgi:hypothetical protein